MEKTVILAGRLLISSRDWPASVVDPELKGRITMSVTPSQKLRTLTLREEGVSYSFVECNPFKVADDIDGNTAHDKVMVKIIGGTGWIGQVRRYYKRKEMWHFHYFKVEGI